MKNLLASLPSGVRIALVVLTIFYLGAATLKFFHVFDAQAFLALNAPDFWHGRYWQIVTYCLLPANFTDFLFNGIAFAFLGARLERAWTRGQFWSFCFITALGAGLGKIFLMPHSPIIFVGLSRSEEH